MKNQILLSMILGLVLTGCSQNSDSGRGDGKNGNQQFQESYQLSLNGCDTGKHVFTSASSSDDVKKQLCEALQNDSLNKSCAEPLRRNLFENKCSGYAWSPNYKSENTNLTYGSSLDFRNISGDIRFFNLNRKEATPEAAKIVFLFEFKVDGYPILAFEGKERVTNSPEEAATPRGIQICRKLGFKDILTGDAIGHYWNKILHYYFISEPTKVLVLNSENELVVSTYNGPDKINNAGYHGGVFTFLACIR